MLYSLVVWCRRYLALAVLLTVGSPLTWLLSPRLPDSPGPHVNAEADGKRLFEYEWTPNDPLAGGDGLGPVFNARSCVACHFQGGVGGGGGLAPNVHNFTILPSSRDPQMRTGTIHSASTTPALKETFEVARKQNPTIVGGPRTETP